MGLWLQELAAAALCPVSVHGRDGGAWSGVGGSRGTDSRSGKVRNVGLKQLVGVSGCTNKAMER